MYITVDDGAEIRLNGTLKGGIYEAPRKTSDEQQVPNSTGPLEDFFNIYHKHSEIFHIGNCHWVVKLLSKTH